MDPPWRRLDARTRRDIVEEWLRGMAILAHGGGRPTDELLAEIAAVNDAGTQTIRLMSPLMGSRHHPAQKQRLGSRPGNGDRPEARVGSSGAVFPECKVAARAGYLALSAAGARWRVRYTVARETVNSSARSANV